MTLGYNISILGHDQDKSVYAWYGGSDTFLKKNGTFGSPQYFHSYREIMSVIRKYFKIHRTNETSIHGWPRWKIVGLKSET